MLINNTNSVENSLILIVEDNLMNMLLLKTLLVKRGYEIIEATNGKEALEVLENFTPDIILMDINMPIMDGYEASIAIRNSNEPIRSIPIIAVTAELHPDTRAKVIQSGMNDYIPKPIDIDDLINSINNFI
jgi:CheY-like chemotaxis protein